MDISIVRMGGEEGIGSEGDGEREERYLERTE